MRLPWEQKSSTSQKICVTSNRDTIVDIAETPFFYVITVSAFLEPFSPRRTHVETGIPLISNVCYCSFPTTALPTEIVKIPHDLLERWTDTLGYAA